MESFDTATSVIVSVVPKVACAYVIRASALIADVPVVRRRTNISLMLQVLWALFFLVIVLCLNFWEEVLRGL